MAKPDAEGAMAKLDAVERRHALKPTGRPAETPNLGRAVPADGMAKTPSGRQAAKVGLARSGQLGKTTWRIRGHEQPATDLSNKRLPIPTLLLSCSTLTSLTRVCPPAGLARRGRRA